MMAGFAEQRGSALITGVPVRQPNADGELRYYNGLTTAGEGAGTYLKQKLVPFGEYVPLQELLRGLIAFFDLPMSDSPEANPASRCCKPEACRSRPTSAMRWSIRSSPRASRRRATCC